MNEPFIHFHRPSIGEEEINEVVETLKSGWLTTGPRAARFETDFREYKGSILDLIASDRPLMQVG